METIQTEMSSSCSRLLCGSGAFLAHRMIQVNICLALSLCVSEFKPLAIDESGSGSAGRSNIQCERSRTAILEGDGGNLLSKLGIRLEPHGLGQSICQDPDSGHGGSRAYQKTKTWRGRASYRSRSLGNLRSADDQGSEGFVAELDTWTMWGRCQDDLAEWLHIESYPCRHVPVPADWES